MREILRTMRESVRLSPRITHNAGELEGLLYRAIFQHYTFIKSFVRVLWLKTLRQELDNLSLFNAKPLKVS